MSHSAKFGKGIDEAKLPAHMLEGLPPSLPARETGCVDKEREYDKVDNSVS